MAVDPREVAEMARIRRIMNGDFSNEVEEAAKSVVYESHQNQIGESSDPTTDMKEIMRRLNQGVTNSVERIVENDNTDLKFASALVTEKTDRGVKVGSWEIKMYEENGQKTYDVCHVQTEEPIARDLTLYESALTISKLLNAHVSINSHQIRNVLALEDEFAKTRNEAATFKRKMRRMTESNNLFEAHVAEARFNESRTAAVKLRDRIIVLSKTL